jgi:hypothetical protein
MGLFLGFSRAPHPLPGNMLVRGLSIEEIAS